MGSKAEVLQAVQAVQRRSSLRPRLAFVLGSGFGHVLKVVEAEAQIAYGDIPGFPAASVPGHSGTLVVGRLGGLPVMVLNGRAHYYEGHSMDAVTFGVRTLAACGIRDLLLTNAAGGLNRTFRPGDFMMLTDHINLMGANPLRGPVWPGWSRFVDLTQTYDLGLRQLLQRAAKVDRLRLRKGVYLAVSGPSYETPAEIGAFAKLGADAVGMSTVPEAIVARQCGVRVAGLSCITNLAAGRGAGELSHEEVLDTARHNELRASGLIARFAKLYAKDIA